MVLSRYKELLSGSKAKEIDGVKSDTMGRALFLGYKKSQIDNEIKALKNSKNVDNKKLEILTNTSNALSNAYNIERGHYKNQLNDSKKERFKSDLTRLGTAGIAAGGAYALGKKILKKTASEEYFDEKVAGIMGTLKNPLTRTGLGIIGGAAIGAENGRQKAQDNPNADEETSLNSAGNGAISGALMGGAALGLGGAGIKSGIKGIKGVASKFGSKFKTASEMYYDEKIAEMNVPSEEEKKKVSNIATSDDSEDNVKLNSTNKKIPNGADKESDDPTINEDADAKDPER